MAGNSSGRVSGLVFSPWNFLLLIPFILLITPIYNSATPELWGMPFFYWFQFAMIPVSIACTALVHWLTRGVGVNKAPGKPSDVDSLDEGSRDR